MRIALISLARRGGMVHYQQELAKSLATLTPIVVVCADGVSASYFPKSVRRCVIDVGRGPWTSFLKACNPLTWYRILRLLRGLNADIFHIIAPHEWNPIIAYAARIVRKPLIYTVHDPIPHQGAPVRMRISNALLLRLADVLVVLTRHGYTQLTTSGVKADRLFLIPMMAHSAFVRRTGASKRRKKTFLFFGRIEPYKGLKVLITAFQRIRRDLKDWELVIAGNGPLPVDAIPAEVTGIRVIRGYVPDRTVARIMRAASVVVLPYLDATQSGVIAIAVALGKPVIATRVGGLPEMVLHGKTGLVVAPDDVAALARAMSALARSPSRLRRMGRRALSLARSRWSPQAISKQHMALYSTVMSDSRAR